MAADCPNAPNTMNVAAPKQGAPAAIRLPFYKRDSKKNYLAQRGPKHGGRATPTGREYHKRFYITYLTHMEQRRPKKIYYFGARLFSSCNIFSQYFESN